MTIPIERSWAVRNVRLFLYALTDPKQTPKVPSHVRRRAASLLKHYPGEFYMQESRKLLPEIWGAEKEGEA